MKPILFYLGDSPVYSYPLLMGIGWGMAYNLASMYWHKYSLSQSSLRIYTLISFIMGWIGAKVFFLIFSTPDQVLYYAKEVNFWLGGGFVFYGGLVFVAIFSFLFFKLRKDLEIKNLGLLIPGVTLGHAIGRLGCFLAGCCYGSETDSVFSIHSNGHDRFPVQLIESAGLLFLFFVSKRILNRKDAQARAIVVYLYGYATLRFFNEFLRGDEIRGLYFGLATSQWVSIFIILITSVVIAVNKKKIIV